MRRGLGFLLSTGLALLLAGCPGESGETPRPADEARRAPAPAAPAAPALDGAKLYAAFCSACHGPNAKGIPNLGKDLSASEFVATKSDEELLAFVKEGRPADDPLNTTHIPMPPKGGNPALQDAQILAIVRYLRGISES